MKEKQNPAADGSNGATSEPFISNRGKVFIPQSISFEQIFFLLCLAGFFIGLVIDCPTFLGGK